MRSAVAGEHEEVLGVGFPVVHPDRLARPEHEQVDPELLEVPLEVGIRRAGEREAVSPALAPAPAGLPRVEDEPPLPGGHEPGFGLLRRGFGDHRRP